MVYSRTRKGRREGLPHTQYVRSLSFRRKLPIGSPHGNRRYVCVIRQHVSEDQTGNLRTARKLSNRRTETRLHQTVQRKIRHRFGLRQDRKESEIEISGQTVSQQLLGKVRPETRVENVPVHPRIGSRRLLSNAIRSQKDRARLPHSDTRQLAVGMVRRPLFMSLETKTNVFLATFTTEWAQTKQRIASIIEP